MNASATKHIPWNEHTVYAFGFHRRLTHILGYWPLTCAELQSKIRFLIVVLIQISMNYHVIREFTNGCISVEDGMHNIGLLFTTGCALVKILVVRAHYKEMYTIFESAVKDWSTVIDDKQREIMLKYANIGRTIPIFQSSFAFITCAALVIVKLPTLNDYNNEYLMNSSDISTIKWRNLPMTTGCSTVDMSFFIYLAFYSYHVLRITNGTACLVIPDGLFIGSVMHLCGQLEVLNFCMSKLGRNIDDDIVKKETVTLIKRHNHLYRDMNFLEDAFNILILCQQATVFIHSSLMGVQILYNLQIGEYKANVPWIGGILTLLGQSYIYSYGGECLTSLATNVRLAAYSCAWYNFSPSLAKNFLLVMLRPDRTFHITAGKVYIINNESYASMLKTMFSFLSVLKLTMVDEV